MELFSFLILCNQIALFAYSCRVHKCWCDVDSVKTPSFAKNRKDIAFSCRTRIPLFHSLEIPSLIGLLLNLVAHQPYFISGLCKVYWLCTSPVRIVQWPARGAAARNNLFHGHLSLAPLNSDFLSRLPQELWQKVKMIQALGFFFLFFLAWQILCEFHKKKKNYVLFKTMLLPCERQ